MTAKKTKRKKKFVSRKLGLAFEQPSKEIHDLDERAYQFGEKHKKDKYAHHALSKK